MRIENEKPGYKKWAALDRQVLAVFSRREDGWCIYIGAVPGENHSYEWPGVAATGSKLHESVARVILREYFGYDSTELEYAK